MFLNAEASVITEYNTHRLPTHVFVVSQDNVNGGGRPK